MTDLELENLYEEYKLKCITIHRAYVSFEIFKAGRLKKEKEASELKVADPRPLPIAVQVTFSLEDLQHLLITCFEGGSTYWVVKVDGDYADLSKSDYQIVVYDGEEKKKYKRGLTHWLDALQLMYDKYPSHFRNLVDFDGGTWDAETADVFLQLACFKEIVYG